MVHDLDLLNALDGSAVVAVEAMGITVFGGQEDLVNARRRFVDCVRTGTRPRVSGEDGLAAVELATRVLASLRQHQWEGRPDGPTGPDHMPLPIGRLFDRDGRAAA